MEFGPIDRVPQSHVPELLGVRAHTPVVMSQQTPAQGLTSQTLWLLKMFEPVQAEAIVTEHDPSGVQHAPPQGLLGAHEVNTPWNEPEQAPGAV